MQAALGQQGLYFLGGKKLRCLSSAVAYVGASAPFASPGLRLVQARSGALGRAIEAFRKVKRRENQRLTNPKL